jgi:hypothetical protein
MDWCIWRKVITINSCIACFEGMTQVLENLERSIVHCFLITLTRRKPKTLKWLEFDVLTAVTMASSISHFSSCSLNSTIPSFKSCHHHNTMLIQCIPSTKLQHLSNHHSCHQRRGKDSRIICSDSWTRSQVQGEGVRSTILRQQTPSKRGTITRTRPNFKELSLMVTLNL